MTDSADPNSAFARLLAPRDDDAIDLAEAALIIARCEYPDLDVARYLWRLDELAIAARERISGLDTPYAVANALSEYLGDEEGFAGNHDEYYDARNSYLNDVLDRKLGIPITLSVLYLEVARRLGLQAVGAGMPGHFLVKYIAPGDEIVVDPFHRGIIMGADDYARLLAAMRHDGPMLPRYLDAMSKRDILIRMLNNLKQIYVDARDYARALQYVELSLIAAPASIEDLHLRDQLRHHAR